MRLLTLIGPPGIGKTRLGLQVAMDLVDDFADGVWFIALASIRDPGLVAAAIAQPLGLQETGGQSLEELLQSYLREKALLLVLDNFEHVAAQPSWSPSCWPPARSSKSWRRAVPRCGCKPSASSRSHRWRCPIRPSPDLEAVARAPAVALFVERAQAVMPDFTLQTRSRGCDGDLSTPGWAAAGDRAGGGAQQDPRSRGPAQAARQPAGAAHQRHARRANRQQTLRAAIAWSYDLLNRGRAGLFSAVGGVYRRMDRRGGRSYRFAIAN